MAVRTPLVYDDGLREATAGEIDQIKLEMIRQYGLNPGITLSVVPTGGDLTLSDTRLVAGEYSSDNTTYPNSSTTADVYTNTINYSRISITNTAINATDTANREFFTYYEANTIQSFSLQDMVDTFAVDVVDTLTEANNTSNQTGTYLISTEVSLAGASLVNSTPVFVDTRADETAYTSDGIPEALDQPVTITNFYLHVIDSFDANAFPLCVRINDDDDLQEANTIVMGQILANVIQYTATQEAGSKITYTLDTGNVKGTGMTDTILDDSLYANVLIGSNDYRAQEFPAGSPQTANTVYLRITQV